MGRPCTVLTAPASFGHSDCERIVVGAALGAARPGRHQPGLRGPSRDRFSPCGGLVRASPACHAGGRLAVCCDLLDSTARLHRGGMISSAGPAAGRCHRRRRPDQVGGVAVRPGSQSPASYGERKTMMAYVDETDGAGRTEALVVGCPYRAASGTTDRHQGSGAAYRGPAVARRRAPVPQAAGHGPAGPVRQALRRSWSGPGRY